MIPMIFDLIHACSYFRTSAAPPAAPGRTSWNISLGSECLAGLDGDVATSSEQMKFVVTFIFVFAARNGVRLPRLPFPPPVSVLPLSQLVRRSRNRPLKKPLSECEKELVKKNHKKTRDDGDNNFVFVVDVLASVLVRG